MPGEGTHLPGFGLEAGSPTQLAILRPQFPLLARAERGLLEIKGLAWPALGGVAGNGHVEGRLARGLPPTWRSLEPEPGARQDAVRAWRRATTPGLLRSRSPGPEGTCSRFRRLSDNCAGGWTRSGDGDDSSSSSNSSEDWSAGSSSSHTSRDTMDLSFMAAQVT